jgi:hypothetical protein
MNAGAQPASSIESQDLNKQLDAGIAKAGSMDAKKVEELKKQIDKAVKNITVTVDTDPNSDLNTEVDPKTGQKVPTIFDYANTNNSSFVFVSPSETQSLTLLSNGNLVDLNSKNKIQVIADSYNDMYIPTWWITQALVGKTKNNPSHYKTSNPLLISLSTNSSIETAYIDYGNGAYGGIQVIKIPKGQFVKMTLTNTIDASLVYPDTYTSQIIDLAVLYGWNFYQGQNGLTILGSNWQTGRVSLGVPSNKSNEVLVTGEVGPYILKYPVEPINQNSIIPFEGARLGSQVKVHATRWSNGVQTDFNFNVNTNYVSSGRKSFNVIPINHGINLVNGDSFFIQVENVTGGGPGLSNQSWLLVQ